MRIETGPVQFGQDWPCCAYCGKRLPPRPGLFMRGDDCFGYGAALHEYLKRHPVSEQDLAAAPVRGLLEMLKSPDVRRRVKVLKLKDIEKCIVPKSKEKPGVD